MNLPNWLTISRIGMSFLLLACLQVDFPYTSSAALIIFILASITDFLDGHLARNVYGVSGFGKLMDPLADKIMVSAAFISFVQIQLLPAWMVVMIISREFMVTGLRLLAVEQGVVIPAGTWGKHKTVWQIIAIVVILLGLAVRHDVFIQADADFYQKYDFAFGWIAFAIGIAATLITLASGWNYFIDHRELIYRALRSRKH